MSSGCHWYYFGESDLDDYSNSGAIKTEFAEAVKKTELLMSRELKETLMQIVQDHLINDVGVGYSTEPGTK
jgi:hypothetical protein